MFAAPRDSTSDRAYCCRCRPPLLCCCGHASRVSEDFQRDPISHMMQLPEWLGLDPALVSEEFKKRAQNNGGRMHVGRYDAHPLESTMQQLDAFFAPHNERLFKLLEAKGFGKEAARMREVWWPASSADKLYKKASTGGGRSAVV